MASETGMSLTAKLMLAIGFVLAAGVMGFGVVSFLHTRENVQIHQEAAKRKPNEPSLQAQLRHYEEEHGTARVLLGVGAFCLLVWVAALAILFRKRGSDD